MTTMARPTTAQAAGEYAARIADALTGPACAAAVDRYVDDLRAIAGHHVTRGDYMDLLVQHALTRPLFDALFTGPYPFAGQTRISLALAGPLAALDAVGVTAGQSLAELYDKAREKGAAVTDHAARQPVICALYEAFYRTALPRVADRLGIVFTPVEVVDFILRSADQATRAQYGCGLSDERVQIIDPFAGTGVFFVRLIQSDLIRNADLSRVYRWQMHGHEIVPLSWYIAVTNIEIAYAERTGRYLPFTGLSLVDTFDGPACCDGGEVRDA